MPAVACGANTLTSPSPSGAQKAATGSVRSTRWRREVSRVSSVVCMLLSYDRKLQAVEAPRVVVQDLAPGLGGHVLARLERARREGLAVGVRHVRGEQELVL